MQATLVRMAAMEWSDTPRRTGTNSLPYRSTPGLRRTFSTVSVRGVIFDLGSTLIHRIDLDLEREKCRVLASFAAAEWGCTDPDALARDLLEIRLDGWRRANEELVERPVTRSIALAFASARLPTDEATLRRAEAVFCEPEVRISRLYPGVVEVLNALHSMGLRLGMISNAPSHHLVLDITAKHRIGGYFDPLVTSAASDGSSRTQRFSRTFSMRGECGRSRLSWLAILSGPTSRAPTRSACARSRSTSSLTLRTPASHGRRRRPPESRRLRRFPF